MAIFIQNPNTVLSEVEIRTLKLLKLTSIGRVYIEGVKEVPNHIWAEIDQTVAKLIELIPPDEPRRW
jgi:DNA gyrase/topoisomerase IV subunit A